MSDNTRPPMRRAAKWGMTTATGVTTLLLAFGPAGISAVGADTSLQGYNATTLAVGAQFAFNVPGVVPLPNENLIEEDAPFARTNVGQGPVVDSLAAPYYPGDIAANLGSLLAEFGAPSSLPDLNETLLAHTQFPSSPSEPGHATFGEAPAQATPLLPSIFYATSDSSNGGGDATATLTDLALDPLGQSGLLQKVLNGVAAVTNKNTAASKAPTTALSLVDVGNISAATSVSINSSSITDTATSDVKALDIAGMIDIADITSTANATSDGTTGTPTSTLHLGQVTVDGATAFIDNKGVHIASTSTASSGITPAQLQQTVNATLTQDGISIQLLNPQLTTNGAQAQADAGGLQISISHQIDVPYIPGEPTIPLPVLGNEGLPAGLYTATTSLTFGLAQAAVAATGLLSDTSPQPLGSGLTTPLSTSPGSTDGFGSTGFNSFGGGDSFTTPSVQSVAPVGPGAAQAVAPHASSATDFPIRGVAPPLGWTIALLLGCLIMCYPLLLLARWQFVAPRRR
jgi:hypothetical protein